LTDIILIDISSNVMKGDDMTAIDKMPVVNIKKNKVNENIDILIKNATLHHMHLLMQK